MNSEVLIRVESVSKKFCRDLKKSLWYGVRDIGREITGREKKPGLRPSEFWALEDISFELGRGEVLGLIGRNGAGKTTLLKILNNLIKPDSGKVTIKGRVGALISLGAGFNPVLTGRENVYINGAVLGLKKKEITAKFDEIVDFAELEDFIDTPVQSYSSGMKVRLGFAVAATLNPDVLLLDEVLAVGDMGFRIKCLNAVRRIMNETAVVFVSHSMQFVSQFCTRIAVMERGAFICDTRSVAEGIDCYLSQFPSEAILAGTGGAVISNVHLRTSKRSWRGEEEAAVVSGEDLSVFFDVKMLDPQCKKARFTIHILDQGFVPVIALTPYGMEGLNQPVSPGLYRVKISLGKIDLNVGKYCLVISVENADSSIRLVRLQGQGRFRVTSDTVHWGQIVRKSEMQMERL